MLHQLTKFFRPNSQIQHAYALYAKINDESRAEHFFEQWGVSDTLDGRFELILLHMFLYLHAMKVRAQDSEKLQRFTIEAFFDDMDRSIREFGVGDTGVGRRVKNMANAFYGRINAFEKSLDDDNALKSALLKNTFATCENAPDDEILSLWVNYIRTRTSELINAPIENLDFLSDERA